MAELRCPGRIRISERAVSRIVIAAIASVPGTVVVARGSSRLAGRTYPRIDVQLDDDGHTASIEAFIAVSWPSPVIAVSVAVRATIIDWVQAMTGITALRVNVVVGLVVSSDEKVTPAMIDARLRIPRLKRLSTREVTPFIDVTTEPRKPLLPISVRSLPIRAISAPPAPQIRSAVKISLSNNPRVVRGNVSQ